MTKPDVNVPAVMGGNADAVPQSSKPLKNARWENFAQAVAQGATLTKAYLSAGYEGVSYETARRAASVLMTKHDIQTRIDALRAPALAKSRHGVERYIQETERVALATMGDVATWGPDGVKLRDSSTLTPEAMAAIVEVSETVSEKSETRKIKLHNKLDALDTMLRLHGKLTNRVEADARVLLVVRSLDDLAEDRYDDLALPSPEDADRDADDST